MLSRHPNCKSMPSLVRLSSKSYWNERFSVVGGAPRGAGGQVTHALVLEFGRSDFAGKYSRLRSAHSEQIVSHGDCSKRAMSASNALTGSGVSDP